MFHILFCNFLHGAKSLLWGAIDVASCVPRDLVFCVGERTYLLGAISLRSEVTAISTAMTIFQSFEGGLDGSQMPHKIIFFSLGLVSFLQKQTLTVHFYLSTHASEKLVFALSGTPTQVSLITSLASNIVYTFHLPRNF